MTVSPISWNEQHGGCWNVTGYQECRAAAGRTVRETVAGACARTETTEEENRADR
jgi:hypothetical protein